MTTPDAAQERRSGDRRRGDRRQGDRRQGERRREPGAEESWYGVLGLLDEADHAAREGVDDEGGRFLARRMRSIVQSGGTAWSRVFRAYVAARAALGVALALAPWVASSLGARPRFTLWLICLAYATQAVTRWLLPGGLRLLPGQTPAQNRRRQWMSTVGLDLLAFSALHLLEPASPLNFSALLVLPVLMAGVMTRRISALATASFSALVLLAGVWLSYDGIGDVAARLTQAGLTGIGLFVIVLLAGEMAQRLAREERTARGSLEFARQQAQLNRLVIEEMSEGVLVIDRRLRVRAANPAARGLLGGSQSFSTPFGLDSDTAWDALRAAVETAYARGEWPETARELAIGRGGDDQAVRIQVRARFTLRRDLGNAGTGPEDFCVLFIEDVRAVQARLRQERLAAMGRVSAGIAHEFRNPLAAISQANDLLREDPLPGAQARLATIVADNAARLKRIVDDVIEMAGGSSAEGPLVDVASETRRIVDDWLRTAGLAAEGPQARVHWHIESQAIHARFDPDHLRRVLVNLLDNAHRHASSAPGAVMLTLRSRSEGIELDVASDGEVIAPDVERHLFEPFFSTRSRGSGLGLYISRELCERNGARIDFLRQGPQQRHRNVFRVCIAPQEPKA